MRLLPIKVPIKLKGWYTENPTEEGYYLVKYVKRDTWDNSKGHDYEAGILWWNSGEWLNLNDLWWTEDTTVDIQLIESHHAIRYTDHPIRYTEE